MINLKRGRNIKVNIGDQKMLTPLQYDRKAYGYKTL